MFYILVIFYLISIGANKENTKIGKDSTSPPLPFLMNYSAEDTLERWDNGSFGDIDHPEIRNSTSEDEDSFWTKERLMIINSFPPHAFFVMGLIISAIAVFGLIANGTVLFIFSRSEEAHI